MGHILDFAIRHDTNNQKSLDDWMRLLYSRHALPKPGFEPADAVKAASEVAGTDLSGIFRQYISGKEPIPYEQYFGYAGIAVEKKVDSAKPWIGIDTTKNDDGRAKVRNIIPGSPTESAGLDRDDIVYAVDSRAADFDAFTKEIGAHKPGDTVRVTVLRFGEFKDFTITIKADPNPTYALKLMEHPTDQQKAICNSWLGIKQ
jgi:predicted metalloprotease with PDZ domain